jgi:hypothetical protein
LTAPSLQELSSLLWRERDVLDKLVESIDVDDDDNAYEGLLNSISSLELHRAITAREAAAELGFDGEPTLQAIVAVAPGEWSALLVSHRQALLQLIDRVRLSGRPSRSAGHDGHDGDGQDGHDDGNVVVLEARRPGIQRSLQDFLT